MLLGAGAFLVCLIRPFLPLPCVSVQAAWSAKEGVDRGEWTRSDVAIISTTISMS
jgi:hypothetical protein